MKPLTRLLAIFKLFTGEILLSLLLGIAAVAAGIGLLGSSAFIIASAALHPSIATLQVAIVGVRFFGISRGVFRYLERLVSHSVNLRVVSRLRLDFMRRVEPGAPANLVTRQGGDLLQSVMGDLQVLENFYVRVISPVVVALVIVVGTSLFIGSFALELGVILFSGMLVSGFLQPVVALLVTRRASESLSRANAEISADLVEFLQGLEDIHATNTQREFIQRFQGEFNKAGRQQDRLAALGGLNSGVSLLLTNLTLLLIIYAAIPLVNAGTISGVTLAVISLVTLASFEVITPLNPAAQNFNASRAAAHRLFSFGKVDDPLTSIQKLTPATPLSSIRFEHVSFSFEGSEELLLENINFTLQPKRKIALVGASGAGKTSLLDLLVVFKYPSSGNIQMNGVDTRNIDPDGIRSNFSVLSQKPHIFNEDVRQNLLLAKPGATDEELVAAISQAGLSNWLSSLPEKLDTWIGERGIKMSGGERQRLAFARLYLQDRPYILLDEPTTSLDQVTAGEVMTNLFDWTEGKGMLIITHDLRWMPDMDEIMLLEKGRIIERGSLSVLLNRGGEFARMYQDEKDRLREE
jgi:ATP-binding cassette subfamily C protein CydC